MTLVRADFLVGGVEPSIHFCVENDQIDLGQVEERAHDVLAGVVDDRRCRRVILR